MLEVQSRRNQRCLCFEVNPYPELGGSDQGNSVGLMRVAGRMKYAVGSHLEVQRLYAVTRGRRVLS